MYKKKIGPDYQKSEPILVEAGGVEPPSENASSGTSPGAEGHLHSLAQAWAHTLKSLVARMVHGALTGVAHARSPLNDAPSRAAALPGGTVTA